MDQKQLDALSYHSDPVPGKLQVIPSKPCDTARELSFAYTPGVAVPCLAIKDDPSKVWDYTVKGNMVAVVSDGTAVLGLGNIGPEAGMPVMEGKCVLFKHFADIDAIPLCLGKVFNEKGRTDPAALIATVEKLEPTFGGINLEDIGSPACFEVEQTLKKTMHIPVFHDDQHGTAIISLAALLNALELVGKKIGDCRFVVNGAGAAGISCSEFYVRAGADRGKFILFDSKGAITKKRDDLTAEKKRFAADTDCETLADALRGADVFLGLSVGNCVTKDMVASMAPDAVIFAMANPVPEIFPADAWAAGAAVVGTGRTDFPNQINNVLGFPGIFRGALDVRATDITENMKLAASSALAHVAKLPVSAEALAVLKIAYPEDFASGMFAGEQQLKKTCVIPKPFDPRVVPAVARFVAEAAMKDGVARQRIDDLDAYERGLFERIAKANRR